MLTREEALKILEEENTPPHVVEHCEAVARKAVKIAERIKAAGHEVNIQLVETGALLHDVGRAQSHGLDHGFVGGVMLRGRGLKEHAHIAERHIAAGLDKQEAKRAGLPPKEYIPQTLEEKIIADADNLIDGTHPVPIKVTIQKLRDERVPEGSIARVSELYAEVEALASSL
ncbi:MAG: HD domain-containing protein [Candidatus Diapherotrites archaeon]|nr:HD domain-containing protein [Candidatus Diapherotrites archaeon]